MQNRQVIKAIAAFDFLTTLPFVLPWTASIYLNTVFWMHDALDFAPQPAWDGAPLTMLFVNIVGILAVIWAIVRWRTPSRSYAHIDACGRLTVAAILLFHIAGSVTPVLLIFVATELVGAIWQFCLGQDPVNESPGSSA